MKAIKKPILIALSIMLIAAISIGITFSFLNTQTSILDNKFAFGPVTVEVVENFKGWDVKEVRLKNTSDKNSGVVRVMLIPRVVDSDGIYVDSDLVALSEPKNNKIILGDFTFELDSNWSNNWFYRDGFFYCKKVLAAGETSPLLLKKVSLTNDLPEIREKYKDLDIKTDVVGQILQADGGAPQSEWNVVVNGNVVSAS